MDKLTETFNTAARVTFDQFDTYSKHPRFSSYKEKFTKSNQEERRKEFLKLQKEKKITSINLKRGINEKDEVDKIEQELMEVTTCKAKKRREFKDALMLSEWLIDVPDDFLDKWIVVPCPMGKRVLLIAENGTTVAYARKGFKVLHKFPSGLPGGCYGSSKSSGYTRLDCIWHQDSNTLYILDALDLGPCLVNCESEFRFTWLSWKYAELKCDISEVAKYNRFRIVLLDRFRASQLADFVLKPLDSQVKMDGLLFYHEEGLYEEFGRSPLVTWLKPYMVPDVLGMATHPDFIVDKPTSMEMESTDQVVAETSNAKS